MVLNFPLLPHGIPLSASLQVSEKLAESLSTTYKPYSLTQYIILKCAAADLKRVKAPQRRGGEGRMARAQVNISWRNELYAPQIFHLSLNSPFAKSVLVFPSRPFLCPLPLQLLLNLIPWKNRMWKKFSFPRLFHSLWISSTQLFNPRARITSKSWRHEFSLAIVFNDSFRHPRIDTTPLQ